MKANTSSIAEGSTGPRSHEGSDCHQAFPAVLELPSELILRALKSLLSVRILMKSIMDITLVAME